MCGILGTLPAIEEQLFLEGLNRLEHRGPDGYGIWKNPSSDVLLGHRRLSILDLSEKGKQPMHYQHLSITFNGEIYNFIELRKELILEGYEFHSDSDTEVILASYLKWGINCLKKFNGMWSLAIWNEKTKELFLSRDRYGKKPLFYSLLNNKFVFGSEMKAVAALLPEVNISSDFNWCYNNLYLYESTDKCLIQDIKRFPASCYALFKAGDRKITPVSYWNTLDHLETVPVKYEDQVEHFKELFEDACRIRMRSDVNIGTGLSGGLDSSAIVSMISHINRTMPGNERVQDVHQAVIATFPGSKLDEQYYAQKVVDHLGLKGEFIAIDAAKSLENFGRDIYNFEEIYTTPPHSMIETYKRMKQLGITVSLDGHGADEMFSGYGDDIYEIFFESGISFKQIKEVIQTRYGLVNNDTSLKQYLDIVKYPIKRQLKNLLHTTADAFPVIKNQMHMPVPQPKLVTKIGHLNSLLHHGFTRTTLPTLLRNFDRISMAASVEIRMPFLDHRLVDYTFSLPWHSKVRNGYTKSILRDSVKELIPNEVVYRKSKLGFNTPTANWVKGGWKEFILDTINSQEFKNCTLVNARLINDLANKIMKNENENYFDGYNFWILIAPFFWEKYFLKEISK